MRRVNNNSDMSWHKARIFVNKVFRNKKISLESWNAMKRPMFKRDKIHYRV
jgi:hypothetical protein